MNRKLGSLVFSVLSAAVYAVEFGSPFVDGAVLQRDRPVRVWGFTAAGERVKVCFAGLTRICHADEARRWKATLTPMPADATSRELSAEGESDRAVVRDVVVNRTRETRRFSLETPDIRAEGVLPPLSWKKIQAVGVSFHD